MAIQLSGRYTDARVLVDDESLVEESALDQIQELVDHPAFTEPVRIMPDTHWGAGAPIGFTMPLPDRIVPNIVGVDVGCGMCATNLGPELPLDDADRERAVREVVPMGRNTRDYDDAVHLVDEFPFDRATEVFDSFAAAYEERFGHPIDPLEFDFDGYDGDYFESLCARVLAGRNPGMSHIIQSAGTLGGGNHFVEFARSRETGDYWLVVHSGSRYLGLAVAQFWQARATERRNTQAVRDSIPEEYREYLKFDPDTVSDEDLYAWVTGGMGESPIDKEHLRADLDGKAIEHAFDALGDLAPDGDADERNTALDWLAGREAHGYYVDMLFAQQYARWNRELMSEAICEAVGVDPVERFQSPHNMIDFDDLVIRKGATAARKGQRLLVPFNMAAGSVIARGKGDEEWNQTAPHGAGRRMGRRDARDSISKDEATASMEGVYTEHIPIDEAPAAYKNADSILENVTETMDVVERLDAVHNLKA